MSNGHVLARRIRLDKEIFPFFEETIALEKVCESASGVLVNFTVTIKPSNIHHPFLACLDLVNGNELSETHLTPK
jgi:hypothetical protein